MFCQKCGTQLQDGTRFCPNCGFENGAANAQNVQPAQQPMQQPAQPAKKKKTGVLIGAVVGVLVIVAVLLVVLLGKGGNKPADHGSDSDGQPGAHETTPAADDRKTNDANPTIQAFVN